MVANVLALVAALASLQDGSAPRLKKCELEGVVEKDGAYSVTFTCPWPKGTALRVEVQRRTTQMSWAPWMTKDATGKDIEKVNLAIQKRFRAVHRANVSSDRDGGFTFTWTPKISGIYHLQVTFDPAQQTTRDPRFRDENRSVHRIFALKRGQTREIIVDDCREALRFSAEFFKDLRAAIARSNTDNEVEAFMRKQIEEALRRGEFTQHPGTYSLMEQLSPYVLSLPKDPAKDGPDEPRVLSPNKIDVKTANLPHSIVRESLVLAIIAAEDGIQEAALLAAMPEGQEVGTRKDAAWLVMKELPGAVADLLKLEPGSRLVGVLRNSELKQVLADAVAASVRMLEGGPANEVEVKGLLERLDKASKTVGDPIGSLTD